MFDLIIHSDARSDLEKLWAGTDPEKDDAAEIEVLLEEIAADPSLTDSLLIHDHGGQFTQETFNVSKWQKQYRLGRNLWRLKFWELERTGRKYRVVYGFQQGTSRLHVLAVVARAQLDYDNNNELTNRILKAYENECE